VHRHKAFKATVDSDGLKKGHQDSNNNTSNNKTLIIPILIGLVLIVPM
jgi:hypothetical protein